VLNHLAWATLGDQENQSNLVERARQAEPFAREAFEKQKSVTTMNEDDTLCLQADWLWLRQLAGAPGVLILQAFVDYLATAAGEPRDQFLKEFRAAVVNATALADEGNRVHAQNQIRQFIQPLLDPSRKRFRGRVPLDVAYAGRKLPTLPPAALGLDKHQLEVCGPIMVEVAVDLAAKLLPPGHPDIRKIARLAETAEHKPGL